MQNCRTGRVSGTFKSVLSITWLFCFRTKETLESGHFLSVINILMQLRKVQYPGFSNFSFCSKKVTENQTLTVPSVVTCQDIILFSSSEVIKLVK